MSDDTSLSDWTDLTERSQLIGVTRKITHYSGENRQRRRNRQLRADLVREHIENRGGKKRSLLSRLFGKN